MRAVAPRGESNEKSEGRTDLLVAALDCVITGWGQGELASFLPDGELVGPILDTGCQPQWAGMELDFIGPPGSQLTVAFRSSDDPGDLGQWSEEYTGWCGLSGLLDRYFQYRVSLWSSTGGASPILQELRLYWDPDGMQAGEPEHVGGIRLPGGNAFPE